MPRTVRFPIVHARWGDEQREITFETLAVPPRHDVVQAVFGLIFSGEEILLVRRDDQTWALPGGERMPGETFAATLARTVWDEAGGLLSHSRLMGGLRSATQDGDMASEYQVYMTAELRELVPFSNEFAAQDRMLIDVGLAPSVIAGWNQLMDEVLAYVQAARNAAVAREAV